MIKYIYFLICWIFVFGFRIVYHLLDNVSLCTRKTATKLALGFFYLYFFIVRLPHWVLDLSLNAQSGVNKFYLLFILFIYLIFDSFHDEAVSIVQQILIVCIVFYLFFVILHSRPIWFCYAL